MGTRIKLWNALGCILLLAVFAASLGVFWLTRSGDGFADLFINLIFCAVAFLVLAVYFLFCAGPLTRMVSAMGRVKEDILFAEEEPKTLWARYSKNESPFGNRRLDERYGAYLREMRRLYKQNAITADCDIDEYINEQTLYSAVNKPFCDQIGGIMSGLGILFTFIGLVYGLRNFDASTVDMMQSSTQALMAGIKIAFLTSIFGLIYSLLFNIFYKRLVKSSVEALYQFQDVYTEHVRPSNAHGAENAMLRLQTEQNAALERFGSGVGEQVSEAIITLMKPTVDEMHASIREYTTVAMEDQRAGMERVVKYFLESMNTSLGNVFLQLKARMDELNGWEQEMIASIRSMTDGMGQTAQDLAAAELSAKTITQTMAAYTATIEELTAAQTRVIGGMEALMEQTGKAHEEEKEYLKALSQAAKAAEDTTAGSLRTAQTVEEIAGRLRAGSEDSAARLEEAGMKVSAAAESARAMSDAIGEDVSAAARRLESSAVALDAGLNHTVEESLARVDGSLAKLTEAAGKLDAAANGVTQALKSVPKSAAAADTDFKTTAKVIDTELKLLLTAVSDTQKILNRFNADLERRMGG